MEITGSADAEDAGTLTRTYGRTVTCGIDNPAPLEMSVTFPCGRHHGRDRRTPLASTPSAQWGRA